MNVENARSNYNQDRSGHFKHNLPSGLIPPSAPTVQDYVNNEKAKQMSKMRDWYLESKNSQTDLVSLRTNFSNSRNCSLPQTVEKIDQYKGYLIAGAVVAAIAGGLLLMHFR